MYAVFAFFAVSTAGACSGQAPASSDQAPATPQALGASTTSASAPPSSDPQPTQAPEPQPTAAVGDPQTAPTNTAGTQVPAASGCDPAKEPHRRYLGDREKCMLIKYRCEPPQQHFSNACGCGCE
ncbi:hypothetical protein KEG38_22295 [Polyangium jinanense]|uniref:hypothetical protein n=1 Tax=Polyangium jinanense TaxID=2829994 RepID=UPI0023427A08|nr:hypothetical protein [Polyangium jinanense]MDC3956608.1 hypothetical protein [Polyangium jinanense]